MLEKLRVAQVAKLIGVSNQAVYKRLSRVDAELSPHIIKEDGVTFIDSDGVAILTRIFANSKPEPTSEAKSTVVNHVDTLIDSVVGSLRNELDQKQRIIESQQATINNLIAEHAEAQRRNDTIVLKLTNDVGAVRKQLEYREQLTERFSDPPKPPTVWTPPERKDPLEGKSWLARLYIYLLQPEQLRCGADA